MVTIILSRLSHHDLVLLVPNKLGSKASVLIYPDTKIVLNGRTTIRQLRGACSVPRFQGILVVEITFSDFFSTC